MSRSGYCDDNDGSLYRGAVRSAMRGTRGQKFLRDLLDALLKLPDKKLITDNLEKNGAVCALGAVGKERGIDMTNLDPEDAHTVAAKFNIAEALAREVVYENDEGGPCAETPEQRFSRMLRWANYNWRS
jgi:hypothetical protein